MKGVLRKAFFGLLVFMQIAAGPSMHPDDPMIHYEDGVEDMEAGAMMGAALYVVSKILGQTIGDTRFAEALRNKLPFMYYVIPPKGWLGWKEESLNLAGLATLGAAIGSVSSGGELAQEFQFGLSDALSQRFLTEMIEFIAQDEVFSPQPPFIDLVMVKTASHIIQDQLIPAGIPPFRGHSREVLLLNGAVELTAMTFIGALEGAALATLYAGVRDTKGINMREFLMREMAIGAFMRGTEALETIVLLGPRVHVSESEREKIESYARARGVDLRWALDHAQFRDGRWGVAATDSAIGKDTYAFATDRSIIFRHHPFDPKNSELDASAGAHEAYHLNQSAKTPNWIYLRVKYPDFRRGSDLKDHDSVIFEQFPSSRLR